MHAQCRVHFVYHVEFYFQLRQMKAYLVWGQLCSAPCIVTCLNFGVVFIVYVIFIVPFLGRLQSVRWVKKNGGFSLVDGGSRKHLLGEVKKFGGWVKQKKQIWRGVNKFCFGGKGKKRGVAELSSTFVLFSCCSRYVVLSSSSTSMSS